jgi:glycosyltransferase involved in cell wall biosynthesis
MRLISNPDKCKEMGLKGKNIIEKKFTWDKVARQMSNVYKEILDTYQKKL